MMLSSFFSQWSHEFLTLPTGNIWKIILLPYLFVQPIAAHDFTIYLLDTHTSFYATFEESSCVEHYSLWCTAQRGGDRKWAATRWVTADSSWRTWLLPGAARGWEGWWQYAKFSPHGLTERKKRTISYSWSVLLSYKLICMWAFSSPLRFIPVCTILDIFLLDCIEIKFNFFGQATD